MVGSIYTYEDVECLGKLARDGVEKSIGERYGRLIVTKYLGKTAARKSVVECKCDCGATTARVLSQLKSCTNNGVPVSCGCQKMERIGNLNRTHSSSKRREYNIWCGIKNRVNNPTNTQYQKYNALGGDDDILSNFDVFMSHMGMLPDDGMDYSVDRIDNKLGYVAGNMRWASRSTQRKNQGMRSDNSSGITGVYIKLSKKLGLISYVAGWQDMEGKQRLKYFPVSKYGELALTLACEYRCEQIKLLNTQGAGYSENHGKLENTFKY